MSDDYYESLGRLLNNSFANDIDPFEVANKRKSNKRGYRYFQEQEKKREEERSFKKSDERNRFNQSFEKKATSFERVRVPKSLLEDFATLQVLPSSSLQECKHAWKTLLKKYHPDINTNDSLSSYNYSDIVIRLNSSYRRIEQWFKSENT